MTTREAPTDPAATVPADSPPRYPDPRGPDELKAGRRLEEVWAANAARIAREARAKATAAFWEAVEPKAGAAPRGAVETVTSITARRRAPRP